jgi:NAD+ kinase
VCYILKKVGLFVKKDIEASRTADKLEAWLSARDVRVVRKDNVYVDNYPSKKSVSVASADLLCVFVLGGDGTFLSAVRWIGNLNIPVLGVKFGEVGFLAETTEEHLYSVAESILNNNFTTSPRMRLSVEFSRDGKPYTQETVLNDVVINKGALARLAHIKTYIDDQYLTTYKADGLIVSTPTGSTAYSLAAGGPIVHPSVSSIILTPISPFTLTNRPLIVPGSSTIMVRLAEGSSDIMLTFDGQAGLEINERDTIIIRKSPHQVQLITLPDQNYFDVLKTKLRWSGGGRV